MNIEPIEFNCLIRQDEIPKRTKIGLILPEDQVEKRKHAQTLGTLVATSPLAFSYADWPEGARKPEVGDRVVFARFAGTFVDDPAGGEEFRVLKDKDIVAVIR
jgi:Co-chaperonin GroES (HSP10)